MNRDGYNLILCSLMAACILTACGQQEFDIDDTLPYGKYPLTLNTDIGVSVASRAGSPDGVWSAGCSISLKSGEEVKRYVPRSAGASGVLQVAEGSEPFYWTDANETKAVSAWSCGGEYLDLLPDVWTVESDQEQEELFRKSDLLYAPSTDISFAGRNEAVLKFYHQTARVDINIVNAEAATDQSYVRGVTVGNDNLALTASYAAPQNGSTAGVWTGHSNQGTITPMEVTPASEDYVKSYSALVIPQDMTGKQFIAVTLADGITYYYTPKNAEAVLAGGKRYTYDITVHFGHIEVKLTEAVNWNDQSVESTVPEEVEVYRITPGEISIPEEAILTVTDGAGNILSLSNGSYVTYDKGFILSVRLPGDRFLDKFKLSGTTGGYTLTSEYTTDSGSTYIYRFNDITSDISLGDFTAGISTATPSEPKICDFYYLDGTWSSELRDKPCIGVVFWTGDPTAQDPTLKADHPGCTHGLVLAVNDASSNIIIWQQNHVSVQSWLDENCPGEFSNIEANYDNKENLNVILGYNNTKAIEKYNSSVSEADRVKVVDAVGSFRQSTPAPPGCSDWYLPSIKELTLAFGEDKELSYSDRILTNTMFGLLYNGPFAQLGVTISNERNVYFYFASTEYEQLYVWCVRVFPTYNECAVTDAPKDYDLFKARGVLAF